MPDISDPLLFCAVDFTDLGSEAAGPLLENSACFGERSCIIESVGVHSDLVSSGTSGRDGTGAVNDSGAADQFPIEC